MKSKDRLCRYGPEGLSDSDLWEIVLSSSQAAEAVSRYVPGLDMVAMKELQEFPRVGLSKAARVAAVIELGKRMSSYTEPDSELVCDPKSVFDLLSGRLMFLRQERFLALALNSKNRVTRVIEIAAGSLGGVEVHPREVFRPLLREAAASTIVVHNHPSGDPAPSYEDKALTRRIKEVGNLVGISLLDHVIIGKQTFFSFAESGLL